MNWFSLPFFLTYFILVLFAIALHELSHTIAFIIFGIPVEKLAIGIGPSLSVPLQLPYLKYLLFGIIPLGGYTLPHQSAETLAVWKMLIVNLAGVSVNIILPLLGSYLYQKRGLIFGIYDIIFFDVNLLLATFNLIPVTGFDGSQAYLNMLTILGFSELFDLLYNYLNVSFLLIWTYGWIFLTLFWARPILMYLKRFIKYDSRDSLRY